MEPINSNEQSAQAPGFADLEQPVQELNAEEADQVQGGFTAVNGVKAAAPVEPPAPLRVKMTDILITS